MAKYIVNPIQVKMKESERGSVYESIVAMGFRARQINDDIKYELKLRMQDVVTTSDLDITNHDQLEISKEFERLPKPTFRAMEEMYKGKLSFHYQDLDSFQSELTFEE
jgi:DNA-directed RNA polymerase subunit K/omega